MLDEETIKKARSIWHAVCAKHLNVSTIEARESAKRGITIADVSRVFPGARVVSAQQAKTVKEGAAQEKSQPEQLRLIQGGKGSSHG